MLFLLQRASGKGSGSADATQRNSQHKSFPEIFEVSERKLKNQREFSFFLSRFYSIDKMKIVTLKVFRKISPRETQKMVRKLDELTLISVERGEGEEATGEERKTCTNLNRNFLRFFPFPFVRCHEQFFFLFASVLFEKQIQSLLYI